MKQGKIVVLGLGEVGKPLFEILSQHYDTVGIDLDPVPVDGPVDVLHVCYPFEIPDFVGVTCRYIEKYQPRVTVINSTVGVGTTREVAKQSGTSVVNSPVRGKHVRMREEMLFYTKFVGAMDPNDGRLAAEHFTGAGMKTRVLTTPEATELAKLTETTYFGVIIAWAQEVERYCDQTGANYDEVTAFYEEVAFFPRVKYFPGVIGGHCVMPNIEILLKRFSSDVLEAVRASNQMKVERDARRLAESEAAVTVSS